MFNLDTIFNLLRTLLGGLIDKFKAASPSLYTAIVTALLTIEGFILVILERDIFKPATEGVLNIVLVVIAGLLTVIGANEIARRAERFKNVTPKSATRTWVISLLFIGAFVASVWLITKNEKTTAPAEATPTELQTAPPDVHKPLTRYIVTLLATKADTIETIRTGGLPSFRVPIVSQYTFPLFPVDLGHVPTIEDFQQLVLKDGYKIDKVVMVQVYPDR